MLRSHEAKTLEKCLFYETEKCLGGEGLNNLFKIATKPYLKGLMTLSDEVRMLYLR